MKVDLLSVGMSVGADYSKMRLILKDSYHKRRASSNPLIERQDGQSVESLVEMTKALIKEGDAEMMHCGPE